MKPSKTYLPIISRYEHFAVEIAKAFVRKMYEIPNNEPTDEIYFIGDDPAWTLGYWDEYWSLSTMYEVLLYDYPIDRVWKWYDYHLEHWCRDTGYYISLKTFIEIYDPSLELDEWAKKYMKERDENTAYWNSEEWKKETEERVKPLYEEFEKQIEKFIK